MLRILSVADMITRIGDTKVFGKALTQAQFNILMILKRHGKGGMSQKDILANCVSTKGNVSIHIGNLVVKGYIKRRKSRNDSRRHVITMTPKGRRILERLEPRYIEQLRKVTDGLPGGQTKTAIKILDRLRGKCRESLCGSDNAAEQ